MNPTNNQPTDDDTLTLYYYADGLTASERSAIEEALRSDATVAARYQALRDALDNWQTDDLAAPGHLVPQLQATLERAAHSERQAAPRKPFHFSSFVFGSAVTAMLVLAIGAGLYLRLSPDTDLPLPSLQPEFTQTVARSTTFSRGLQSHLRDSQFELAALPAVDADQQALLVLQIVDQNRLFERAAEQNGADDVARVLRAFEPILLRLASGDIAPQDAEALRAQLSFELQVMLTKLSKSASKEPQTI